ncbi:MAG TPA: peptidyl-prolyl cis-trans isomerase [Myxococcales bacterium]|nr:peptidyl-prolyl cis-trans isomerase [Myxococcales bacterium]
MRLGRLPRGRSVARFLCLSATLGVLDGCRRDGGAAPSPVVATVNGEAITAVDLKRELAQSRRGSQGLGPRSEEEMQVARKAELQRIIERTELLQSARQAGVQATEEDVDKAYLAMRADYPGTSFDELLADEEISPTELKGRLRDQLTIRKLFSQNVFSRVAVTEPEVEAYYASHKAEFDRPEEVHAEQIVVKTEEEAQALRTAIKAGKLTFEDAARKHSLSPDAKDGGDLGWFGRGTMPPIFDEVCFSLTPKDLSDVVSSSYGFHLFRVLEKRPAGPTPLDEAKTRIEAKLRSDKNAKAEQAFLDALHAKATVSIDEQAAARVR